MSSLIAECVDTLFFCTFFGRAIANVLNAVTMAVTQDSGKLNSQTGNLIGKSLRNGK